LPTRPPRTSASAAVGAAVPPLLACGAVLVLCAYRAASQSIVHDEALTYNWFLVASTHAADLDNHVLHTRLVGASVALFGLSELSMRLPALLGTALYLFGCVRLVGRVVPDAWAVAGGVLLLAANPLVLDLLCLARGYSLALGALVCALAWAPSLAPPGAETAPPGMARSRLRERWLTGLGVGLSISSNLAFAPPALSLWLLEALDTAFVPSGARRCHRLGLGVAPLVCAAILGPSLVQAETFHFESGHDSLFGLASDLLRGSFADPGSVFDLELEDRLRWAGVVGLVWIGLRGWRSAAAAARPVAARRLGIGLLGMIGLSLGQFLVVHQLAGLRYPVDRTAIYLVTLLGLAALAGAAALPARPGWLRALAGGCGAGVVSVYLLGLRVDHFRTWRYDAGARAIFLALQADHEARASGRSASVGGDWLFEPALNFYRARYGSSWLEEYTRVEQPDPADYDYFVWGDAPSSPGLIGTTPIYRDPISGAAVFARAGTTRLPDVSGAARSR